MSEEKEVIDGVTYNSKSHDKEWAKLANRRLAARKKFNGPYSGKAGH